MEYIIIINRNRVIDEVFKTYSDAFLAAENMICGDSVYEGDDFDIYKLENPAASGTVSIKVEWDEYDPE